MIKKLTVLFCISLFLLTINNCSSGDKKVTLQYKYKPGVSLSYKQKTNRYVKVLAADSLINEKTTSYHVDVNHTVNRILNDSTFEIQEKATWHFPQSAVTDSSKKMDSDYSRETTFQVLRNGKIVDFKTEDEATKQTTFLKNYYEQGLPVFPEGEVFSGYSWTQSTKVVLPDEAMEASTTYKIKSLVRESGYDCAVIEYEGNLIIPITPVDDDPTQRTGVDRIKSKGLIYFAYKEGFVVKQIENWETIGERTKVEEGEQVTYKVLSNYDVDFSLIKVEGL